MTNTNLTASFYNANPSLEHTRLQTFNLEYAVSLHHILTCVQTIQTQTKRSQLRILDLGGGTGRYAVALARLGHSVILADISSAELGRAEVYAKEQGVVLEGIVEVDALRVDENKEIWGEGEGFDVVLCMGPLYHLLELGEREKVLRDCATMVRGRGCVFVAFVSKWAHLRDLVQRDVERVVRERGFYEGYLGDGRYVRGLQGGMYHVDGVGEIRGLFDGVFGEHGVDGRLEIEKVVAAEGFLGGGLSRHLSGIEEGAMQMWVDVSLKVCEREEILGASDHLLVVARKR